ncbi:alpha/beta fold hydrolase [Antrihabitans sp. YC2-6]|uniref:alpha/beta fold hydrolase n=1 Tax=Antrihabitans sp. YC2-6 TaxID=2799498 RepID=UPI0018F5241B|nr:alpha/beta hydrolase [Antrihabitans sp. YC2-6]MBJ8347781.1 alpha/beta hydrolase [Antrihabitans sp. YC2-6]
MTEIFESTITARGITSPVLQAGPREDTTAVVFIHGNPGSSHDFRGLLKAVGPHGRAIAIDMPGFGRADKPRDFSQTPAAHARHLESALDDLGVERVHLVLHDFGGMWGLAWAAAHPDRVESVTLIDTGLLAGYTWHWLAQVWQTPIVGELMMAFTSRTAFRIGMPNAYPFKRAPKALPADFIDHMAADFDADTRSSVLRLYRACKHIPEASEMLGLALAHHNFPALVIWGGRDHFLPAKHAAEQREAFPSAKVVVLAESGHWPMIDNPVATEQEVVDFLAPMLAKVGA